MIKQKSCKEFKMRLRFFAVLCAVLLIFCQAVTCRSQAAVTDMPRLYAGAAVLINADTGEVLYDKYKDWPAYPASTTKIMTAILTLENLQLDQVCTVSHNAAYTEGSRIYLLEGEQMTVENLLYAMLLASANDAAVVLAEACGGSVEGFADMMNAKAEELGAEQTHFVTPNGLPDAAHVTSAGDMALFAREAMKNETFRKIISTYEYIIPPTELQPEQRMLHNTNKLLYDNSKVNISVPPEGAYEAPPQLTPPSEASAVNDQSRVQPDTSNVIETRKYKYEGILGIKTGYTNSARSCLVAAAERDGMTLIGVIYRSEPETVYSDMIQLLDFGFNNFESLDIGVEEGKAVGKVAVKGGARRSVEVTTKESVHGVAEIAGGDSSAEDKKKEFSVTINSDELRAPVEKGAKAGTLVLKYGSKEIGRYDLFTMEAVSSSLFSRIGAEISVGKAVVLLIVLVILLLGFAYLLFVLKVRRQAARQAELRRQLREKRSLEAAMHEDDLQQHYQSEHSGTVQRLDDSRTQKPERKE